LGSTFIHEVMKLFSNFLKEFKGIFTWSHKDMPVTDQEIVERIIWLYPIAKHLWKLHLMKPK